MTVDVSLSTQGHLRFGEIQQVLESAGCGAVTFQVKEITEPGMEMTIATFAFRDPEFKRRSREMRAHHFTGPDPESDPHISGDEYTYCVMGAHDGGPRVMRALGEAFSGKVCNDTDGSEEVFERPGSPAP